MTMRHANETPSDGLAASARADAASAAAGAAPSPPPTDARPPDPGAGSEPLPLAARERAIAAAERLLQRRLEAVLEAVVDAAIGGDMAAAKIVLDRCLPAPRDRHISFALRPIARGEDAINASADVLAAVARGRITPAEADAVAKLLHNFIEASGLHEFERRLEALEADSEKRP
jgi:hypothetical protein